MTIALESHVARLQATVVTVAHQERPEYRDRLSMLIVLLIGMAFLTFLLSGDTDGDYFVPDNWPLTLTFFVAFGGATFLAHNAQTDSVRKQTGRG